MFTLLAEVSYSSLIEWFQCWSKDFKMFRMLPELSENGGSDRYLLAIAIKSTIKHTTRSRVDKKVVGQSNH